MEITEKNIKRKNRWLYAATTCTIIDYTATTYFRYSFNGWFFFFVVIILLGHLNLCLLYRFLLKHRMDLTEQEGNTSFWTTPSTKAELIVIDIITLFYIFPSNNFNNVMDGTWIKPSRILFSIISCVVANLLCVLNVYVRWVKDKGNSLNKPLKEQNAK